MLTPDQKYDRLIAKEAREGEARLAYLANKYHETGNRIWIWIAAKEGFDVDYKASDDEPSEPKQSD